MKAPFVHVYMLCEIDMSARGRRKQTVTGKKLTPAAQRALSEAEKRRAKRQTEALSPERKGPKGPEPTRYGDWEKKGIVSDF